MFDNGTEVPKEVAPEKVPWMVFSTFTANPISWFNLLFLLATENVILILRFVDGVPPVGKTIGVFVSVGKNIEFVVPVSESKPLKEIVFVTLFVDESV